VPLPAGVADSSGRSQENSRVYSCSQGHFLTAVVCSVAGGAWAETATLTETDEGEEIITLPKDNAPYVFRNASGAK
jgi:hypothetical protein